MGNFDAPTAWSRNFIGHSAATVRQVVPGALHSAHQRALESHKGLGLASNHAYGQIYLVAPEELVKALTPHVDVRLNRPRGAHHALPVVGENNVTLYPWKFSDNAYSDLNAAKMRTPVSDLRRDLLSMNPAVEGQMTLDQAMMSDEELQAYDAAHEAAMAEARAGGSTVIIAYASNPQAGLLRVYWGDASGTDEHGHVLWNHVEQIPITGLADGQAGGSGLLPVGPAPVLPRPSVEAPQFNDAPMPDIVLSTRPPLASSPDPERPTPHDEAGSDD